MTMIRFVIALWNDHTINRSCSSSSGKSFRKQQLTGSCLQEI
ncbi:UNVERIFIED_CONTAM: hypothetical protein GTU68_037894 [Idotea baltica]|nr:hypothetical protein [Idotea baltica]